MRMPERVELERATSGSTHSWQLSRLNVKACISLPQARHLVSLQAYSVEVCYNVSADKGLVLAAKAAGI